jgi:hypothetical protein
MRARSLLDVVDRSRRAPDSSHPAVLDRQHTLESIAAVQRMLMDPSLDAARRRALLTELERLEQREQEARRGIALAFLSANGLSPNSRSFPQCKPCCRNIRRSCRFKSACGRPTKAKTAADRGWSW